MNLEARSLLLGLSCHCDGEWEQVYRILKTKERISEDEVNEAFMITDASFTTIVDEDYADSFKEIYHPPFLLYYYGNFSLLSAPKRISVVGTREPSSYQTTYTDKFVSEICHHYEGDVTIISGMARGLDAVAMRAAMKEGAPVVAVLGSGINNPYPKENKDIYEYCKSGKGLVISEYPNDVDPIGDHFVFRNRLIAALCQVALIMGGKKASGTSTTVRYATELGREIFALPCNISGDDITNSLIADGVRPLLSADDVISELDSINKISR